MLDPHRPIELSVVMEMFHICAVQYGSHQPHVAVDSTGTVTSEPEELKVQFHLTFTNVSLKLNGHMWLVATVLDSVG